MLPFAKNKARMQKFEETGDSRYIYQNELDNSGLNPILLIENL